MNKLAVSVSILATLAAAACTTPPANRSAAAGAPGASAAGIVTQRMAFRAGTGVVENVMRAPAPMGAAAGSSATTNRPEPPVGTEASGQLNRLAIRMDRDHKIQYVDVASNEFMRGTRVELMPDGTIKKL
jgi:hypothetical protein